MCFATVGFAAAPDFSERVFGSDIIGTMMEYFHMQLEHVPSPAFQRFLLDLSPFRRFWMLHGIWLFAAFGLATTSLFDLD